MIEDDLRAWLRLGLEGAARQLGVDGELPEPELQEPRQREHGDFATNVALAVAPRVGLPARTVADAIVAALPEAPFVRQVDVAGPGFINVFVTPEWLHGVLRRIVTEGSAYGRASRTGRRVQVEFVSANPTGPAAHRARAQRGARRRDRAGAGRPRLGRRARALLQRRRRADGPLRRLRRSALPPAARARRGAAGGRLRRGLRPRLAREILDAEGPGLADLPPEERFTRLRAEGARRVLGWNERTLARFGVRFDTYVSEASLAEKGQIDEAIGRLRTAGAVYEAEGAVWFRSTDFGDDKDRVLIRSNGMHTYFAADCAYLLDKFARGFDHLLYVWGADHHGDIARVRGAAQTLGFDPEAVEIVIYQWVSFLRGGEPVPMSKRAGTFVSLDELIDEVGADAARFHLLLFSNDHTMSFDIEAVKRQSMDNPVYYVQYGHARIASILRKAEAEGVRLRSIEEVDLGALVEPAETELLRALADVPDVIARAAELRAPHRIAHASQDLAASFHRFYTECRVVSDDAELTQARLWLCTASKTVLANLLELLGVSAPERMERIDG